ncbi:hypothetical protein CI109_105593 [Kwoniella shandongensis]|uniref:glucosamine-phosphate N-acetyltransferase n=1 Tax=Kwoniella shandongensis TaxID=1734106 RepID=A0A5M6C2N7_9TREE|nr:uncharacterized protein CI109_002310 [Kwoniella shandongensis]KAA5529417.1 hypothetical protein CI109_002310 [Kwoniella shandongensis]
MAYAYPSVDPSASTTSLGGGGGSGGGYHTPHYRDISRKSSDGLFDMLREFKHKIHEDENYISFFQERIRVEEQYIESLTRLYDRTVAIDTLHDDAGPRKNAKPTARRAWQEVRDYTQREIQSREALVGALKEDVVRELVKLKEEQTRIRFALKDNLKLANEMYEDHARNQLPKLKKAYYQKCQALEDHKRQEHAIAMQAKLLSSPSPPPGGTPLHDHPFAIPTGPSYTSPPTANAPLPPSSNPSFPQGLTETTSFTPSHSQSSSMAFSPSQREEKKHGNRLRASSASGNDSKPKDVLNDIAAQSKKGFSAFMQKLGGDRDKEGHDFHGLVTSESDSNLQRRGTATNSNAKALGTMRGVRIKREADEADKAYRLGVFHLESLRLRREKLQVSAVTSLENFNDELSLKMRHSLESYIDTMHGTAATNAQATEVARVAIEGINLEQDIMLFRNRIRSINPVSSAPVPYENFYVGPCRSLIFGVSLTDYDFARGEGSDHGRPPTIVEKCIAAIDEKGLDSEGIYRVSGRHAGVQKMIQGIELDEEKFAFDERDDVFSIGNVLKQYLRELPEPVFPLPHPERVKHTENRESHISNNFSALRARLRRLPPIHQTTFQAIIEHLGRVQQHSGINKMGAKNLAVVFNSVLFGQDQLPLDGNILTMHQEKDTVLEDLITFSDLLFGIDSPIQAQSVLPPGSTLSRSGVISEHPVVDVPQPGSSRTKIKIYQSGETETPKDTPKGSPSASSLSSLGHETVGPRNGNTNTEESQPIATFTPDKELDLLFDARLIPPVLRRALPEDLHVRPLSLTDLLRGHFELLSDLRQSPALAPSVYNAIFAHLKSCPGTYYIVVVVHKETDRLVASGTLVVERKHINGGGASGHLEDIVVSEKMQGRGLGQKLVIGLRDLAVGLGCYKVILDCKEPKIPFYEKCGFHKRSAGMAYYVSGEGARSDSNNTLVNPSTRSSVLAPLEIGSPGDPASTPTISQTAATLVTSPLNQGGEAGLTVPSDSTRNGEAEDDYSPSSPKTFTSASSDTGAPVTYRFPTNADETVHPAWAAEGLGNSALSATPIGGGEGIEVSEEMRERSGTPLPPGAAPPILGAEPERI